MDKLTEQTSRRAAAELFLFGGGDQLISGIWSLTGHSPLLEQVDTPTSPAEMLG